MSVKVVLVQCSNECIDVGEGCSRAVQCSNECMDVGEGCSRTVLA